MLASKSSILLRLSFLTLGLLVVTVVCFVLWLGLSAGVDQRLPVPSPDGQYFAYLVRADRRGTEESAGHELTVCRRNGRPLAQFPVSAGALLWSSAEHLAFVNAEHTEATLIANVSGRFVAVAQAALSPGAEPRWSQDGNRLAYRRPGPAGDEIAIYNFQQTQTLRVPLRPDFELRNAVLLFWSPGGEYLYLLNEEGNEVVLDRLDVVSGEVRVLARGLAPARRYAAALPRLSPDGTKIYLRPPRHSVIDAQTGGTLWALAEDATPLWSPWSADGGRLHYWRRAEPEQVYAHDFLTQADQVILAGVQPNGFFTPDGQSYFYRRLAAPAVHGSLAAWRAWRQESWGWQQLDVATLATQPLGRMELWPWEQTTEGEILVRADAYTRSEVGLLDPKTHRLYAYIFPTRRAEVARGIESHGLALLAIALYAVLGLVVVLARPGSPPARAYYLLSLLGIAILAGHVARAAVLWLEPLAPFRIRIEEIVGLGWWTPYSLAQLAGEQAGSAALYLSALGVAALTYFIVAFPENNRFLAARRTWWPVLYGAAFLPLLGMIVSGPILMPQTGLRLLLISGAVVVVAIVASLILNHRWPPHRRARDQVRWVGLALGLGAAGGALVALVHTVAERALGAGARSFLTVLDTTALVVVGSLAPVAVGYALVSYKLYDIHLVARRGLRYLLTAIPVLLVYLILVGGLSWIVTGAVSAAPASALAVAAVLTLLVAVPARKPLSRLLDRTVDRARFAKRESLEDLALGLPHVIDWQTLATGLADSIEWHFGSKHFHLFVLDRATRKLRRMPGQEGIPATNRDIEFDAGEPLCRYLVEEAGPFEVEVSPYDPKLIPILRSAEERLGSLQAALLLGLKRHRELLGLMALGAKASDEFYNSEELELLSRVAVQGAIAIGNIELFEEVARDRELRKELKDASDMQARLLPSVAPQLPGCQVGGRCLSAREVRGDYFDFFKLPGQRVGLAVGDVCGRGMPASLLMADLQSQVRTQAPTAESLGELFRRINRQLYRASQGAKYCTFFFGTYDCARRRLEFVNAGHNPPLLIGPRGFRLLESTGLPLGLFPEISHESRLETLEPGVILALYSDGLAEARNARGETYGVERLAGVLTQARASDTERLIDKALADVSSFLGGAPIEDDQTLVLLKVNAA